MAESLSEVLVERYAQSAGVDKETAKRILESMKERRPQRFEQIKDTLEVLAEYGDKVKDPILLSIIKPMLTQEVLGAAQEENLGDKISKTIKEISAAKLAIESVNKIFAGEQKPGVSSELEKQLSDLANEVKTLREAVKKSKKSKLLKQLNELQQQIGGLQQELLKLKEGGGEGKDVIEQLVEKIDERKTKAKQFLEKLGYKVEEEALSPERLKELAEKHGFKIVEAKVSYEEYERLKKEMEEKIQEAAKKAYEMGKEDAKREFDEHALERNIQVVERIAERAVDRLVGEIVGPILRAVVTKGGESAPSGSTGAVQGS